MPSRVRFRDTNFSKIDDVSQRDFSKATWWTITTDGTYTIHTFLTDWTFTSLVWNLDVEYMVVAWWGWGWRGAWWGAWAWALLTNLWWSAKTVTSANTVTIWWWWAGATAANLRWSSWYDSVFSDITSTWWGWGWCNGWTATQRDWWNWWSWWWWWWGDWWNFWVYWTGITWWNNWWNWSKNGSVYGAWWWWWAGATGTAGSSSSWWNGWVWLSNNISWISTYYGWWGGWAPYNSTAIGTWGNGWWGSAAPWNQAATSGTANTWWGWGWWRRNVDGSVNPAAGNWGTGIVIVRYPI